MLCPSLLEELQKWHLGLVALEDFSLLVCLFSFFSFSVLLCFQFLDVGCMKFGVLIQFSSSTHGFDKEKGKKFVILSHLLEKRAQGYFSKEKVLTEEYDFVHQALFTDPDDQSGWLYHLWLLEQTVKVENPLLVSTWPPHGSNLNV
ncbi:Geranylgeranyl transferase type-2 subunit alpha 1 [Camellia lanceoleosa]|uniref:Geranylgeranyl transferase type-2 subunit alpha 1 n=1 Tax=Camellia lanceoleosa TaxID=1840588 RepID=A0ACC0G031_9ERIC|nr:Geranylgeranyl transferase type-2 subunit alpha 1 [Camellia lanceoleosa]